MKPRTKSSIRLLPEHIHDVLKNLKGDIQTLRASREVSKTWQHYADRIYFHQVTLSSGNVEKFIKWITTRPETTIPNVNVQESTNDDKPLHISEFVNYVRISKNVFQSDSGKIDHYYRMRRYCEGIDTALLSIPNLKGVFYQREEYHRSTITYFPQPVTRA
ncbi:hypothetical protein HDU76_009975, partial [Blyttiomyces sp. JEL0837]